MSKKFLSLIAIGLITMMISSAQAEHETSCIKRSEVLDEKGPLSSKDLNKACNAYCEQKKFIKGTFLGFVDSYNCDSDALTTGVACDCEKE